MFEKLEAYLEEISHFLSGPEEREEILSEIRSHVLEQAEQEFGAVTDESLDRVIAAYGPARRVAEKYVDGRPIIAPAYKRFLFRYTALLFALHSLLTVVAVVIIKKSLIFFPILYVPSMDPFEALFYLPTAFLFDFGVIALVLYLITQSKREVRLPWPRLSLDLDEVKALGTIRLAVKFITPSPWVDAVKEGLTLVLLGLVFRQPVDTALAFQIPSGLARTVKPGLTITVLVISIFVAVDFLKAVVRIGRGHLVK
jgi:hypothetical protein